MSNDPGKKGAAADTKYSLSKYQDIKVSQVMGTATNTGGGPPDIIRNNSRQNSRQYSSSQLPDNSNMLNAPSRDVNLSRNDGNKSPRDDGKRGILKGGDVSPKNMVKANISKSYAGPLQNERGIKKSFADLVKEKGLVNLPENELSKSRQQSAFSNLVTKILNDPSAKSKLEQERYGNDQGYDDRYPGPNDQQYYDQRDYPPSQGYYDRRRGGPPRDDPNNRFRDRDGYGGQPNDNRYGPADRQRRGDNNYQNDNRAPLDKMNDRSMNNPYEPADKRSRMYDRNADRPGQDRAGQDRWQERPGYPPANRGRNDRGYQDQERGGYQDQDRRGYGDQDRRGGAYQDKRGGYGYGQQDRGYPPNDKSYPNDGPGQDRSRYTPDRGNNRNSRDAQYSKDLPPKDNAYPPRDGGYPPDKGFGDRSRSPYNRDPPGNVNSRPGQQDPYAQGRRGGPGETQGQPNAGYDSRGKPPYDRGGNPNDPPGRPGNRYASPDVYGNPPHEADRRANSSEPYRKSAAPGAGAGAPAGYGRRPESGPAGWNQQTGAWGNTTAGPNDRYGGPPNDRYGAPPNDRYGPPNDRYGPQNNDRYGSTPNDRYGPPPYDPYGQNPPYGQTPPYGQSNPETWDNRGGQYVEAPPDYPISGFDKLFYAPNMFVRPIIGNFEGLQGPTQLRTYLAFPGVPGPTKGMTYPLFAVQDVQSSCGRSCMNGDCRAIDLKIVNLTPENFGQPFLQLTKECGCACLCCSRPDVTVSYIEEGQPFVIGKLANPFVCCDYEVQIFDEFSQPRFSISSECCSMGMYCCLPCPCGESCQRANWTVKDPSNNIVTKIEKKHHGVNNCIGGGVTDLDSCGGEFPQYSSPEDRAVILAAFIYIELRFFDSGIKS